MYEVYSIIILDKSRCQLKESQCLSDRGYFALKYAYIRVIIITMMQDPPSEPKEVAKKVESEEKVGSYVSASRKSYKAASFELISV